MLDVLRNHASVREYKDEAIPDSVWRDLLRTAQQASTDATGQMYSAVDVRDSTLRNRVAQLAGDQAHVHSAPRFLVVCVDVRRLRLLLESRGESLGIEPAVALLFGITDAAIFAQSLCVGAEASGYGICYIGGVQNRAQEIAAALELPQGVLPLWGLTVGRPARKARPRPRLPTDAVIHVDQYRDPAAKDLDEWFREMAAATRSGDWLNPLRKYFAAGGVMAQRETDFRALCRNQGFGW